MATMTEIVNSVKAHLEEGAQLLQEHIPALVEHALQLESDPLVAAVEAAVLPPGVRQLAADFITRLANEFPVPPPVQAETGPPADPAAPAA